MCIRDSPGTDETQTTGYGTLTGTCHFQSENVRCFFFFRRDRVECLSLIHICLGVWGVVNLLEGYGSDNPGAKSQGMKQFMAN